MTTIGERIIERLGGVTSTRLERITEATAARAYEAGYSDANDDPASGDIAAGGYGYRSTIQGLRDFSGVTKDVEIKTAHTLGNSTSLGYRMLNIKRDHITGRNAKPSAKDKDLEKILIDFWNNNNLSVLSPKFTRSLFKLGEQCYEMAVRKTDGDVEMGYINPGDIERVIQHPNNVLKKIAVVVKPETSPLDAWVIPKNKRVFRIIRRDNSIVVGGVVVQSDYQDRYVTAEQANIEPWEKSMLSAYGLSEYTGSVIYQDTNNEPDEERGHSHLLPHADWIDQGDETLFSLADREQFAGYFSWDVSLAGSNDELIAQRAKKIRNNPPKKGSVNVHNESETWTFTAPDLKQQGSIETYRALLGHTLGGEGIPVHWYGFGDDSNRATSQSQSTPAEKTLEYDQGTVLTMFVKILEFVRDQAIIAGNWRGDDDEVKIDLPEVSPRNMGTVAETMQKLALALTAAEQAGWISRETAAETFGKLLGDFGIEVNPQEEIEQPPPDDTMDDVPDDTTKQNGSNPVDVVESYFRRMGIGD